MAVEQFVCIVMQSGKHQWIVESIVIGVAPSVQGVRRTEDDRLDYPRCPVPLHSALDKYATANALHGDDEDAVGAAHDVRAVPICRGPRSECRRHGSRTGCRSEHT
jgi:hypothetical protein